MCRRGDMLRGSFVVFFLLTTVLSRGTPSVTNISIVVLPEPGEFEEQASALECYQHRHQYGLYFVDLDAPVVMCGAYNSSQARRHCGVASFLKEHPDVEWAAVLEASDLVVRGGNSFQRFLSRESDIDVVLMEGVLGGELMSSYLVRNTEWATSFLLQWADYSSTVLDPDLAKSNSMESAALHVLLLDTVLPDHARRGTCMELLGAAATAKPAPSPQYDAFLGCVKCAIGGQRVFPHVRVLRRGQGFAREVDLSPKVLLTDVIVKGLRDSPVGPFFTRSVRDRDCKAEIDWEPPLQSDLRASLFQAKILMQAVGIQALQAHPASLGISDTSECWPTCPPQFSGTELETSYRAAICTAGAIAQAAETAEHETPLPAAGNAGQPRRGRKERSVRKDGHMRPVSDQMPTVVAGSVVQDRGPADYAVSLLEAIHSKSEFGRQDNGVSLEAFIDIRAAEQ